VTVPIRYPPDRYDPFPRELEALGWGKVRPGLGESDVLVGLRKPI
jgi:hypothetical protein